MKIENLDHVQTLEMTAAVGSPSTRVENATAIKGGRWLRYRGRLGSAASATAAALAFGKNTYTFTSALTRTSQYGSASSSSSYSRSAP